MAQQFAVTVTPSTAKTALTRWTRSSSFLKLFPAGPVAVAIGVNAFLALRRPEVEALLPDEIRALYLRQITGRGEDALAVVENRVCSACNTELTAQNYNELLDEKFVVCPSRSSCSRTPADRKPGRDGMPGPTMKVR